MDLYQIKRIVYLSPLANNYLVHCYRFKRTMPWILSEIKKFGREKETEKLLPLIRQAYTKFHWNVDEFFLFKYESLSDEQRLNFCPEYDHNIFCLRVNNWRTAKVFRNKLATYNLFKSFFKRECVFVEVDSDLERDDVKTFLKSNDIFLAKPIGSCCGRGIKKFSSNTYQGLKLLLNNVNGGGGGYLNHTLPKWMN